MDEKAYNGLWETKNAKKLKWNLKGSQKIRQEFRILEKLSYNNELIHHYSIRLLKIYCVGVQFCDFLKASIKLVLFANPALELIADIV